VGESPRHREIRQRIERELKIKGYEVRSSHHHGDITLYRLTSGRTKGDSTALKCPDIYAKKGSESVLVEIEERNTPLQILGDIACAGAATHIAPFANEHPLELPPSTLIVVLDREKIKSDAPKLKQIEVLRDAATPQGCIREVRIETHDAFLRRLSEDGRFA
jgi:hypothetical protein